jgi:hypothetical protein
MGTRPRRVRLTVKDEIKRQGKSDFLHAALAQSYQVCALPLPPAGTSGLGTQQEDEAHACRRPRCRIRWWDESCSLLLSVTGTAPYPYLRHLAFFTQSKPFESGSQGRTEFRFSKHTPSCELPIELVNFPLFLPQLDILLSKSLFHFVESSA